MPTSSRSAIVPVARLAAAAATIASLACRDAGPVAPDDDVPTPAPATALVTATVPGAPSPLSAALGDAVADASERLLPTLAPRRRASLAPALVELRAAVDGDDARRTVAALRLVRVRLAAHAPAGDDGDGPDAAALAMVLDVIEDAVAPAIGAQETGGRR